MQSSDSSPNGLRTVGLLVAVAFVASASAALTAAAPSYLAQSASTLVACAVPDAGVLYHADTGTCLEADHARFEVGSGGGGGTIDLRRVDAGEVTISGNDQTHRRSAACPAGDQALSGGFDLVDFSDHLDEFVLLGSQSTADGAGWEFYWYTNGTDGTASATLALTLTCASP